MSDGDIRQALDDAAETYGISLSPEEREAFVSEAEMTAGMLGGLEPTEFESESATNVRDGADEYNAFLYRCDLPGSDSGPLAPDVATAARVLEAITGPDPRDPSTGGARTPTPTDGLSEDIDGMSVGLVTEARRGAEEGVAAAIDRVADDLGENLRARLLIGRALAPDDADDGPRVRRGRRRRGPPADHRQHRPVQPHR